MFAKCCTKVAYMSKSMRLLSEILRIVAAETEIEAEKIMSKSRNCEVVDARHICIELLYKSGMYISRIAEIMKLTPRSVHYVLTDFDDRLLYNTPLRNNYERALNKLGSSREAST